MGNGIRQDQVSRVDAAQFTGKVSYIPVDAIEPSKHNPRGPISKDESFERLVASIHEVGGLLVPLVVSKLERARDGIEYELLDGERRYWAVKALGLEEVPAHVLEPGSSREQLRKFMFHLHMTREQWKPLQQCRSLAEAYPELARGLQFEEKPIWVKKLTAETNMPPVTARDRVHVLSWGKPLKERVFRFDEKSPKNDIYSYVLAIEASIVDPSVKAFPNLYNHGHPSFDKANEVRGALLDKTIVGFETGAVTNREQIRAVSPLFVSGLPSNQRRTAQSLFTKLIKKKEYQFDDVKAEMDALLPGIAKERVPKPQRLIAMIKALQAALQLYQTRSIDDFVSKQTTRKKLRRELSEAIDALAATLTELQERFHG